MDSIFIDSNYYISLYNEFDSRHENAVKIAKKIEKEGQLSYISDYIFLETVTVLSQRVGKTDSIRIGKHLIENRDTQIIHIDKELHNLSWQIFQQIGKKNISFVDCSILAVMQTEGIRKLLTFDTDDFTPLRKKFRFSFF